jgi:hypothetical protein
MRQYSASPVIQKLVTDRASYFPNDWQDQFYNVVWNVDTAQDFGLDVWGRIVVIGRNIQVPVSDYFGFSGTPQTWGAFGEESFFTGPAATSTFTLADPAYRVLILAKALSNIARVDARSLNKVLQQLFPGRGRAWANDLGSMTMSVTFEFALEPWEFAVLTNGGVFPRPAGVGVKLYQIPVDTFGFAEAGDAEPFNQGTFLNLGAVSDAN